MDALHSDEHDEDELPHIMQFVPSISRPISNEHHHDADDDLLDRFSQNAPKKSVENWENLYQASLQSIQANEDDEPKFETSPQPFFFDRPTPITNPPEEPSYSSTNEQQIDSNTIKSKWQIRLPDLLRRAVGPECQKRDNPRRHTTDIVFQQSNSRNQDFHVSTSSQLANGTDRQQSINPLVKQLKQKFDRMALVNSTLIATTDPLQTQNRPPKLRRVTSLTGRGLTSNANQWLTLNPRPSPDIARLPVRSASNTSLNSNQMNNNHPTHRTKLGPPVSYRKNVYPPPSTTSVVKQLISGGATLVYDSFTQRTKSTENLSSFQSSPNIAQQTKQLKNTNSTLTGRQFASDMRESDYAKINPLARNILTQGSVSSDREAIRDDNDISNQHSSIDENAEHNYEGVYETNK